MERFVVQVDALGDDDLAAFGWIMVDRDEEFALYWNAEYGAHQPVAHAAPRFLVLDDWADVAAMALPVVQTLRSFP